MKQSEVTREKILGAAERELTAFGLYGARIDRIAQGAGANKQLIYAYFESKENLYRTVLTRVYDRLNQSEMQIVPEPGNCMAAMERVIGNYFRFLSDNTSFVNLVMWENLNQGVYITENMEGVASRPGLEYTKEILRLGMKTGEFRSDLDIDQVVLSMNLFCFSYFSNRYTMNKVFGFPERSPDQIDARQAHICDMLRRYLTAEQPES